MLEAPQNDAQMIMKNRFPVPRYIVADQYKSEVRIFLYTIFFDYDKYFVNLYININIMLMRHQARFLLAMLNPSITHHSEVSNGQAIFTDDVSLRVFMEHLMKLAVQS